MGLLKRISSLFGGGESEARPPADNGLYFYVQCNCCGEKLRIRVDCSNELQRDYDTGGFFLRKEMMDGRCFQLMYAEISFDDRYRVICQDVTGGRFITRDEYQVLTR
jgi:hypothetical protein